MSSVVTPSVQSERSGATAYLFLSGLSGILELGAVLYAARSGWPVWAVVAIGLCYQLASLTVRPFALGPSTYRALLVIGAVAGVATLRSPAAFAPAVALTAAGLQGIREEQLAAASVSTLSKRSTRIVGFVGAAAFGPWALVALPPVVALVAWRRPAPVAVASRRPLGRPVPHEVLMVVHQAHYFCYSYVLLFVLVDLLGDEPLVVATAFAAGWMSYSLAQTLLERRPVLPTLVAGHVLVTVVLVVIASSLDDPLVTTVAWVLGGFGGGTVYCIKGLGSSAARPAHDMEAWENIGHVAGSLLALVAVAFLAVPSAFFLAALLAATTALGALLIERAA